VKVKMDYHITLFKDVRVRMGDAHPNIPVHQSIISTSSLDQAEEIAKKVSVELGKKSGDRLGHYVLPLDEFLLTMRKNGEIVLKNIK
jgi:hypothetical protein